MTQKRPGPFVALVCGAVALWAALAPGNSRHAHAVCAADSQDPSNLFTVSPPLDNLTVGGSAPFQVVITMVDTTLLTGPMTMSFSWGDGTTSPVNIEPCGDDLYNVTAQQLSHTYTAPGVYVMQWHLSSQIAGQFSSLAVIVTVTAAPATATPVPPTPTFAPTVAVATATPAAQPTNTPVGATAEPTVAETPRPGETASPSPSPTPGTSTVPPTSTPTRTPTPAPVVASVASPTPPPPVPRVFLDVPDPADVSTDAGIVSTNLVLAGITVWVFFSSVLFNQTMQEHRDEISGWTKRLRPKVRIPRLSATRSQVNGFAIWAGVLGGTGIIYGLLEPGFGFNRASFVLFASVVIGVGIVGTFYSSLEAWSRRRRLRVAAAVRAYPFSLVVAAVCVAASRLLDLHPGVIYGFAASCVVLDASSRSDDPEGRALIVPLTACLGLSVACWLALGVLRSVPGALLSDILEGVAIIVFVGGLEGLFVNLIPLQVMDGAKIYRWNRRIWIVLVLVTAFLVWHVLLNSQGAYFESLRKASSLSVLIAFLIYTAAGVGLWGYFELRSRKQRPVTASGA